jgi:hypothetical protein
MSNFSTVKISNYKLIKTALSKVVIFRFVIYTKCSRLRLKCDGTRRRTGGEVKGKQENGVGNQ